MDSISVLQALTSIPAPPGQEDLLANDLLSRIQGMGFTGSIDAKGNLLVPLGEGPYRIVVTAHMDEIAMLVKEIEPDGQLKVISLGGLYPWKLGEGPVEILASKSILQGVLGFGSIHTNDSKSRVQAARERPLDWSLARVFTGLGPDELSVAGVRPGTRIVVARSRRNLIRMGDFVAGYFLDDRADLVSWLLSMSQLGKTDGVLFVATAAEEVGGEGAQYLLHRVHPEICIALELAPIVNDAPSSLSECPSVWAHDGYAATSASDLNLVADVANEAGISIQFQSFSRGGSDASCSASKGLCARPITLGLPMENSHGFEIMHQAAMDELANLNTALIRRLLSEQ